MTIKLITAQTAEVNNSNKPALHQKRCQSLPRNSKISIHENPTKIQKQLTHDDKNSPEKISKTEILAIALASREGLIREIAHSIRVNLGIIYD